MSKVSVIIPTYNRAHTLGRAIDSVLLQKGVEIEIIVVDDGSTDGTSELLKKYPQLKVISKENSGVSLSRNIGIKESRFPYLAFLDSDDEWLTGKLLAQVSYLKLNPDHPLVHTEEIWIRNGVRVNQMKKHAKSGGDIFIRSLSLCLISPSSALLRREILDEVGLFDPSMIVCEDYDLWLRITSKYEVGFLPKPYIKKYGGHEDQLSAKYVAMDHFRLLSMYRLYSSALVMSDKREALIQKMREKGEILLQGYKKHNHLDKFNEVEKIMRSLP